MLHVGPGAIARRLPRLIRADEESVLYATERVTPRSCSLAQDPFWPFVPATAAHCGRVGSITGPTSLASVVSPATKLSRNFV